MILKMIVFIEFLTLTIMGILHVILIICGEHVPWQIYPIVSIIMLSIVVFCAYIVEPIANWWFDL